MNNGMLQPLDKLPPLSASRTYGLPLLVFAAIVAVGLLLEPFLQGVLFNLFIIGVALLAAVALHGAQRCYHLQSLTQKQADLLAHNERLFLDTLNHASSGLALVSRDGQWIQVNQAICRIVGYTEDELLKLDFQTITHPDDLDVDLHFVQQILNRKIETYSMEKRYIHKDGRVIWILLSVSAAWDAAGNFRHFISRIEDINERKVLQEKLRASQTAGQTTSL